MFCVCVCVSVPLLPSPPQHSRIWFLLIPFPLHRICSQVTQSYTHCMQTQHLQALYLLCLVLPPCPSQIKKQILIFQNALVTPLHLKSARSLPMVAHITPLPFLPVEILSLLPGLSQLPLLHDAFSDFLPNMWPCPRSSSLSSSYLGWQFVSFPGRTDVFQFQLCCFTFG